MTPATNNLQALRLPAVIKKTGLRRSTLYRMIARGDFPAGVRLSERTTAWDAAEIDAWLAAKFAANR